MEESPLINLIMNTKSMLGLEATGDQSTSSLLCIIYTTRKSNFAAIVIRTLQFTHMRKIYISTFQRFSHLACILELSFYREKLCEDDRPAQESNSRPLNLCASTLNTEKSGTRHWCALDYSALRVMAYQFKGRVFNFLCTYFLLKCHSKIPGNITLGKVERR